MLSMLFYFGFEIYKEGEQLNNDCRAENAAHTTMTAGLCDSGTQGTVDLGKSGDIC